MESRTIKPAKSENCLVFFIASTFQGSSCPVENIHFPLYEIKFYMFPICFQQKTTL